VRTEDQVDTGPGPLRRIGLAVAAFISAVRGRMPLRAHVEQVDEEVVGERAYLGGEDAVLGLAGIGAEHAQAADQHRHLRRREPHQLRTIDKGFFRLHELLLAADVVAEAVGTRLERRERGSIRLLLRRIHAARREGHLHVDAAVLGSLLDRSGAAEHDQVGQRDLLAGLLLDRFELAEHFCQFRRLVHFPVLLRSQTYARAVRATTLVRPAVRRGRRPGGRDELRHREARRQDLRLQIGDVLVAWTNS